MLAAVDGRHVEDGSAPWRLPSTWLVDVATAELAVEMLHDAVTTGTDVHVDDIVVRAAQATGGPIT